MVKPVIYGNAYSNHSNLVTTYLVILGKLESFEVRQLDLFKGEHKSPEFVKINPCGQIPTLVDDGNVVFESSAILRYLAHKFKSPLYPTDNLAELAAVETAYEHIRQKCWDYASRFVFNSFFLRFIPGKEADPKVIASARENVDKGLSFIGDNFFKRGEFVAIDRLSLADIALGTMLMHLELAGYKSENPQIAAFAKLWKSQPWFKDTSYATLLG